MGRAKINIVIIIKSAAGDDWALINRRQASSRRFDREQSRDLDAAATAATIA